MDSIVYFLKLFFRTLINIYNMNIIQILIYSKYNVFN